MSLAVPTRDFEPGTTGWTSADLDDPRIEGEWMLGRYEIIEGVLTKMPPAYFAGGNAVFNLMYCVKSFLESSGAEGRFAPEVDIIINEARVVQADAAFLTREDESRQLEASHRLGRPDPVAPVSSFRQLDRGDSSKASRPNRTAFRTPAEHDKRA